jgi:hypothetical protein
MKFSGNKLELGEEVIAALHDHWIVMFIPLIIYISGWILFLFLFYLVWIIKAASISLGLIMLLLAFLVLFITHHLFFLFLIKHLLSILVVTNKRLIRFSFSPFLQDDISYIEMDQIGEIDKKKHGILQNILNYGEVSINMNSITFNYIPYPSKFINLIETIKSKKPLSPGDLKSMGASCPTKYKYLLK